MLSSLAIGTTNGITNGITHRVSFEIPITMKKGDNLSSSVLSSIVLWFIGFLWFQEAYCDTTIIAHSAVQNSNITTFIDQLITSHDLDPTQVHTVFLMSGRSQLYSLYKNVHNRKDHNLIYITACEVCGYNTELWHNLNQTSQVLCFLPLSLTLHTCKAILQRPSSIASIIKQLEWRNFIYIYEQSKVLTLNKIINYVGTEGNVTFQMIEYHDNFKDYELLALYNSDLEYNDFFVSMSKDSTVDFILQAKKYYMLGPEVRWIIDLTEDPEWNLTMRAVFNQVGACENIVVLTADWCEDKISVQACNSREISLHKCELETGNIFNGSLMDSSQVLRQLSWEPVFQSEFQGFNNRIFQVTTLHYPPFVYKTIHGNGTVTFSGLCVDLLDALAKELNFRYVLTEVEDKMFGIKDQKTGKWNGMIGTLVSKKAHLAAAALTITASREDVVDFTFPYWEEPSVVMLKMPETKSKLLSALQPLHWEVWLCLLAAMVLCSFMLRMFTMATELYISSDTVHPLCTFPYSWWYIFGSFLQQGCVYQPETRAGRFIGGSWWIVVLVMYATYTGNLIAFLAISKVKMPFNTLQQMADQTEYSYGMQDGIVQMMLFQEAEDGVYKDLWEGISSRDDVIVSGNVKGFDKVAKENYGFIGERTNLLAEANGSCDYTFIPEQFYKTGFGFAMVQDWPFAKYFDSMMMQLVETGIVEKIRRQHWPTNKCQNLGAFVKSSSVTIQDLEGTMYLILLGLFCGLIALVIEYFCYKSRKKKCGTSNINKSNSTADIIESASNDNIELRKHRSVIDILSDNHRKGTDMKECMSMNHVHGGMEAHDKNTAPSNGRLSVPVPHCTKEMLCETEENGTFTEKYGTFTENGMELTNVTSHYMEMSSNNCHKRTSKH